MRIGRKLSGRLCTSILLMVKLTGRFKEASQGYFHDYNKARKAFGGKLWTAPNTLIREDVSLLESRTREANWCREHYISQISAEGA